MKKHLDVKMAILEKYRTQSDFAIAANTSESRVSRVIRGRAKISGEEAKRWLEALGCEAGLLDSFVREEL